MGINVQTKGYYFGYKTKVEIKSKSGTLTFYDCDYEINSDDTPTPSDNTVTKYNAATSTLHKINDGDHITVYSGPTDLYGIIGEGNITKVQTNNSDGKDQQTTINFTEGVNYTKNTLKSNFNGVKTVKTKKSKKVNISFKKGSNAKEIIAKVAKESGIKIYHFKLVKNKIYKRGYTVSDNPYEAIKKIVKNDCKSAMYFRKGKLVIDDNKTDNPYHEHLYLSEDSGMFQQPSLSDDDSAKTYTLECFDDPRLIAGSSVQISSKVINGLYHVKSVKHTHQNNYEMEVVVYG